MPFDAAKAMKVYQERRATWSPAVVEAYERETWEMWTWIVTYHRRSVQRAWRTLRKSISEQLTGVSLLEEPREEFKLSSPNHLYVLAGEAWSGDYAAYARFLKNLGLEANGDTIEAACERLRITFAPKGNNTRAWWLESSEKAREWLTDQIAEAGALQDLGMLELEPKLISPRDAHRDKRKIWDPDLTEFALREAIYAALPKRQAEVIWLYVLLHDEDRPRETTPAIAEALNISTGTVRWHKAEAAKNPEFRKVLGLW